ncbi:MAG: peptide deformylase [Syntrophomonadaceae bacterium]|jgi:peptide deformylase|nr:peptide deformylase [Syntrophomonadaceae bacterium]
MSVYKIITIPDKILREKAVPVKSINNGVLRLIDNMIDTMYDFDGVGLAAPQIGVKKRIIVLDPGDNLISIINPEIISREGAVTANEGCLSIPDIDGLVERAERIKVKGLNKNGEEVFYDAQGALARVFQHEIDHLDGILFTDLAENVRKARIDI